jgi:hypothetical protein
MTEMTRGPDEERVEQMGKRFGRIPGVKYKGMTHTPDRGWRASLILIEDGYHYYIEISGGIK